MFCIGLNKTGTTSLKSFFEKVGFIVGDQWEAERLYTYFYSGDYDLIHEHIRTAEVFQDFPFSVPGFYKELVRKYPGSKYILSVRENDQVWFNSVLNFHKQVFGGGGEVTIDDLKNSDYIEKGAAWEMFSATYGVSETDIRLYDNERLTAVYNRHNNDVADFFTDSEDSLIVIDLKKSEDFSRLCDFLGIRTELRGFPWENITQTKK